MIMIEKKEKKNFYVDLKGYPRFKDTNELVHRKIAAKKMGGRIFPDYVIHHKDGNKMNFRKENLQGMKRGDHTSLENKKRWKKKRW